MGSWVINPFPPGPNPLSNTTTLSGSLAKQFAHPWSGCYYSAGWIYFANPYFKQGVVSMLSKFKLHLVLKSYSCVIGIYWFEQFDCELS